MKGRKEYLRGFDNSVIPDCFGSTSAMSPKQYHEGYWYHTYTGPIPEVRLFDSDEDRK